VNRAAPPDVAGSSRRGALALLLALVLPGGSIAATIPVTTLADLDLADGACSLREAIHAANTDAAYVDCPAGDGDDRIELAVAGIIVLGSSLPQLGEGLTVAGSGASASAIDGGGQFRIFALPGPAGGATDRLRLEGLRLTGGRWDSGGAASVGADRSLEVADCVIEGNVAEDFGGGLAALGADSVRIERSLVAGNFALSRDGGGVAVTFANALEIVDSTIAGNDSEVASGGGVLAYFVDQVTIRRSTLSGNSAGDHGGGIEQVGGSGEIAYATIVGNLADADGDGAGWGGGVDVAGVGGSLTLLDSVVAGNVDASAGDGDCPDLNQRLTADLVSSGFNFVGANGCVAGPFPAGEPNGNGDFVGTPDAPIDARLGALAEHGGPTPTRLPAPDSPLVDQGSCPIELADQRGLSNPATSLRAVDDPLTPDFDDGCDIGAVERHPDSPPDLPFLDGFESGDTTAWSTALP
jgi:CSLREA domain-containing protein